MMGVGAHRVVLCVLPQMGNNSAATIVTKIQLLIPSIIRGCSSFSGKNINRW